MYYDDDGNLGADLTDVLTRFTSGVVGQSSSIATTKALDVALADPRVKMLKNVMIGYIALSVVGLGVIWFRAIAKR